MSTARTTFCARIATIRGAIQNFNLRDLPPTPSNLLHNASARIIRNGLAVQCFNIFEDFIRGRTAEILATISNSGLPFRHLPEDLQWAATVDAIKALDFQLKLRDANDRVRYAQDYSEKISSTKLSPMTLAEITFFHSSSNVGKEQFRDALAAFAVASPWTQCSGLCSRVGVSGMPADTVFQSFAQRRHHAAHNPNASISEIDLNQSLLDATGLAMCFDILVSIATTTICKLRAPHVAAAPAIVSQTVIPLRFIKFANGRYCESKDGGSRNVRTNVNQAALVPDAIKRSSRENGALVIFDDAGLPARWAV